MDPGPRRARENGGWTLPFIARTPTRIDLAGGTLDIWPVYLLLGSGLTLNVAIDIHSHVWLHPGQGPGYRLFSEDTGHWEEASSLVDLRLDGPLGLVARAVRHSAPPEGLTVVTRNEAPKGSGLGASSSLLVALLAALDRLAGKDSDMTGLVDLAADLEAQTIRVPTGKQDYYAAVHGGANAIWFEPGHTRVESLPLTDGFASRLRRSMVLSFTGEPHFSAPTNWRMVKAYIDGRPEARRGLEAILQTALEMREAWLAEDLEALGHLLAREWENRKGLAEGVSTPAVEKAVAVAAEAGALGSKICGAGGGGCMVSVTPEGRGEEVAAALREAGFRVLDFDFDREGLVFGAR